MGKLTTYIEPGAIILLFLWNIRQQWRICELEFDSEWLTKRHRFLNRNFSLLLKYFNLELQEFVYTHTPAKITEMKDAR